MRKTQKNTSFGQRLRLCREAAGIGQGELAAKIGLRNPSQVSRYESDKAAPALEVLEAIARTLHVDLHWLITGDPSPSLVVVWKSMGGGLRHLIVKTLNILLEEEAKERARLLEATDPSAEQAARAELARIEKSMKGQTKVLQWLQQEPEDLIRRDGSVSLDEGPE